jgi:hydrogenase maturation protease
VTEPHPIRCLILACGNRLRGDDGIGPHLAEWAQERFRNRPGIRVICAQQWTPELANEIACADAAIFIDASFATAPGTIQTTPIEPAPESTAISTHHMNAAELLALCRDLYGVVPLTSLLLSIGVGNLELGEGLSPCAEQTKERACLMLEDLVESAEFAPK